VVAVVAPPVESIGYLRALVDPVFFLPTNTTTLWTATGIVTTYTNVTTSGNAEFFMQDGTGGIAVFVGVPPRFARKRGTVSPLPVRWGSSTACWK